MEIYPIAFDSLGVRSMATFIKASEKIFIDPYAALAPKRYGLKPHEKEIEVLNFYLEKIYELGKKADIAIITHYHYDHHPRPYDYKFFESFRNVHFLIKDFRNEHRSARFRGSIFIQKLKENGISFNFADGKEFIYSERIVFSNPVWHGEENSKVGRVIMCLINSLVFGSDAQNLMDKKALKFVIENNPRYAILDGFPIVFEWKFGNEKLERSNSNIIEVLKRTEVEWIILDHHIAREKNYKEKILEILNFSKKVNKKVISAAEYYNMENLLLEANRRELYEGKSFNLEIYKKK